MGWRASLAASVALALATVPSLAIAGSAPSPHFWTDAKQRQVHRQRSEIARVARRAMGAVVSITIRQGPTGAELSSEEPPRGLGSGFLIQSDGYLLTSAHVIEDAVEIKVALDGEDGRPEEYVARVIGLDLGTDVALLKIDADRKLPVLPLGSVAGVEVADWVVVIGNPFGLDHSVTVGVVSFKGRSDISPNGRSGLADYLQTDAPINPGNSGGPLLNLSGEVVAIANAVNVAGQGIGFATPIDIAKEILPQLKSQGSVRRGWLGLSVQDLTPEVAKLFNERSFSGVIVSEVQVGGPAAAAGLQVGDVIVEVDRTPVSHAQALRWKIATAGIGHPLQLAVRRAGRAFTVPVALAPPPADKQKPEALANSLKPTPDDASTAWLDVGATVGGVDAIASRRTGLTVPFGAQIRSVQPGSAMAAAGLLDGDVVLKVDTREIETPDALVHLVEGLQPGSLVRLFVRRGQKTLPFTLRKP